MFTELLKRKDFVYCKNNWKIQIFCIKTYFVCIKMHFELTFHNKNEIFYKLFNLNATCKRFVSITMKTIENCCSTAVCALPFVQKPYKILLYHLFGCTSHCENIEKRFPLCTKIVFWNIFAHPLTWKIYCGTLPYDVFIAYIRNIFS